MPGSTHRVQKVVFNLICEDQQTAFNARKRLAGALSDSLANVLEEVFDGHSPNGRPHRVRRLEVDLGMLDLDRLDDDEIREWLLDRLRRKFMELGPEEVEPVTEALPVVDTFVHFLRTGRIRWDAQAQNLLELERMILELGDAAGRVLAQRLIVLFESQAARIRFSRQFGREFFLWILSLLHPEAPRLIEELVPTYGGDLSLPRWRSHALTAIVSIIAEATEQLESRIESRLTEVLTDSAEEDAIEPPELVLDEDNDEEKIFYTRNAGIVLLHPYLVHFFKTLGLLNEDASFESFDAKVRAIHLLYHLATGRKYPEEHELLLEKVLCGIPIEASVDKILEIKTGERAESEGLLSTVIAHWGKLGNTSSDGLRQGFLQREGRLVEDDRRCELTVEQRGIDVLLDSLPWSLNRIDLPWMPHGLRVDWG